VRRGNSAHAAQRRSPYIEIALSDEILLQRRGPCQCMLRENFVRDFVTAVLLPLHDDKLARPKLVQFLEGGHVPMEPFHEQDLACDCGGQGCAQRPLGALVSMRKAEWSWQGLQKSSKATSSARARAVHTCVGYQHVIIRMWPLPLLVQRLEQLAHAVVHVSTRLASRPAEVKVACLAADLVLLPHDLVGVHALPPRAQILVAHARLFSEVALRRVEWHGHAVKGLLARAVWRDQEARLLVANERLELIASEQGLLESLVRQRAVMLWLAGAYRHPIDLAVARVDVAVRLAMAKQDDAFRSPPLVVSGALVLDQVGHMILHALRHGKLQGQVAPEHGEACGAACRRVPPSARISHAGRALLSCAREGTAGGRAHCE